jgi:CRP-like cAMP-binding protein
VAATSDLPVSNLFLASLPQEDLGRLQAHCERVDLPARTILYEMGQSVEHCTFVDGGLTSLTVRLLDGAIIEAGIVGREGVVGVCALMGADIPAPHTSMIQMPGAGVRIASRLLRDEMRRRPALLDRVLRYSHALGVQISQTAACNAHHTLQKRLARWLLMAHDRADGNVLPLTQEAVATMLAVRRPGVTEAAQSLQGTSAIAYERGRITVLDRRRLEEASCECYGIVREQFQQLLGWPAAG